jgi:hypothetical protein
MSTSATALASRQDSHFTFWSNQNSKPAQRSAAIDLLNAEGSKTADKKNPFNHVLQFFRNTKIVHHIDHNVLPAGNLYYKDSLVLKFSLTEKYNRYFPLLRGFFGFGKLSGLTISSDKENRTFQVVISSLQEANVVDYFERNFLELIREDNFKLTLKDILYTQRENEVIQDLKRQKLYKSLQ